MDDIFRYVVGLDVGTENVRAVVASQNKEGKLTIVGYNEIKNSGMRKGVVVNLSGPAEAIDKVLGEVERMSGYEINSAVVSTNGAQILTTKVEGMIAVGMPDHEITAGDLERVEQVAVTGRVPANMSILDVVPLGYAIDEQRGIKNPVGMVGSRLEMSAAVITALKPNCENLRKVAEVAKVNIDRMVPSVVASSKAVLNEKQLENGVAVVDFGASTTSVAIFEEGELQYVGVVPAGSNNVTNDLAIVLEVNTEIAEEIKRRYVNAEFCDEGNVVLRVGREEMRFERKEINDVVEVRLDEIFEKVRKELKKAGFDRRLPEGIVLTGGGAKLKGIESFVKKALEASVRIGGVEKISGVLDTAKRPEYATALGLVMLASEDGGAKTKKVKNKKERKDGFLKKIFKKF